MHDLDYTLVAAELDCSPTAARIRVSRGLSGLRNSTRLRLTAPQKDLS